MNNELNCIGLYNKSSDGVIKSFQNSLNSKLHIKSNLDKVEGNYDWLEIIEQTIPYLDNILRNPNRFIVNEEDIIKIELAKKITVESIKHLSRNTNLIQDYNKETGDVKPSKILNITKEESYDTYENRLIYTLIHNMKFFISLKKRDLVYESTMRGEKTFEYSGKSKINKSDVNVQMTLNSSIDTRNKELNSEGLGIKERLEKLDINISGLTNSEVYKTLERLHVALVTPPVKKTNLINKNVNFQYAMKLWAFLQENKDDGTVRKKDNKDYDDDSDIKSMVDETFLINSLIMNSLDGDVENTKDRKELQEKIINNMVSQIVGVDSSISQEEINNIVNKQFAVIKYRNVINDSNIKKIFRTHLDKYFDSLIELK